MKPLDEEKLRKVRELRFKEMKMSAILQGNIIIAAILIRKFDGRNGI